MRCLSLGQLIAATIVITIVSMMINMGWAGSMITTGLLLWYAAGFLMPCEALQIPMPYTGEGLGVAVPAVYTTVPGTAV